MVEEINWSKWHQFPDPRKKEELCAPYGHGVYELKKLDNWRTGIIWKIEKCSE